MRVIGSFAVDDIDKFKQQLLRWSTQFTHVVWLDSNSHKDNYSSFDALLAADAESYSLAEAQGGFTQLEAYKNRVNDWIFGYLTYDLKNDLEALTSKNFDGLQFPSLCFFQPKRLILLKGNTVIFQYLKDDTIEIVRDFKAICGIEVMDTQPNKKKQPAKAIKIKLRIFKEEYFKRVEKILAHIHRGDIYELTFCQEFYAENTAIDPLKTFKKLNAISQTPMASYVKINQHFVLCASPERYLKKKHDLVLSQPIKGTARRSDNLMQDRIMKRTLESDLKERTENIMIVDLVRHDFSKSALKGSVKVDELCTVRTYKQVHQMVSTVSAIVSPQINPIDILKHTFPMGSMTGAPKISAMQIIEAQESFKRGLYSGAIGYFSPEGDFDFNVVIRSILYNAATKYVSFSVGSAITAMASPEKEYEECLLKAKAMREVLENE
ncbi:anthranilate synthase component I family protein [Arenibacter sp. GZD96]|uniref:anthranilate synthase component I family protein n=1 Tax=Aurantibrevibacter litoralis TaxID=3106030 RepID=UPI002AFFC6FE|nr:anthranilate synthase component I family protein [Arenibacter sp. GZD-96]MEA1786074.1 anthranilate synthase component I family protein [Arenibacter sp. GZD-96]